MLDWDFGDLVSEGLVLEGGGNEGGGSYLSGKGGR